METDEILISKTVERSEVAFEELVKRYDYKIINLIYKYVNNTADAEELAQEVFLKVWKYAKDYKGKSKFSTWLYRIAVNVCLNFKKKKILVTIEFNEKIYDNETGQSESYARNNQIEQNKSDELIRTAIDSLPPKQKIALVLSRFENKSYNEIAEIMDISISSVESLLFRGKQNLKQKLS